MPKYVHRDGDVADFSHRYEQFSPYLYGIPYH